MSTQQKQASRRRMKRTRLDIRGLSCEAPSAHSVITSYSIHYTKLYENGALIVIVMGLVLWLARRLPATHWPGMASLLFLGACLVGLVGEVTRYYEVNAMGEAIGKLQREGRPVAVFGKYHGEFNFVGRLQQPVQEIERNNFV